MIFRRLVVLSAALFSCLVASLANAGCTDPRELIRQAKDPSGNTVLIAMHRGAWSSDPRLPENSMGSFITADRSCLGAIEADVRLTRDKVPVLLHDQKLGRLTNAWTLADTTKAFLPETDPSSGTNNPAITELPWAAVSKLKLLSEPYKSTNPTLDNVTGYAIETVASFYDQYLDNRMSLVVFLEIKDADAAPLVLKHLFSDKRDYTHGLDSKPLRATEFTILKFSATTFPTPESYRAAVEAARKLANAPANWPVPIAYPYYASNTLQFMKDKKLIASDPYTESIEKWIDDTGIRIGIELNLKEQNGILQTFYDQAVQTHKVTLGNLHAEPDFLRLNPSRGADELLRNIYNDNAKDIRAKDASYDGTTGTCCYQLKDLLDKAVWNKQKDSSDKRPDPSFLLGSGSKPKFRIITTDNYKAIRDEATKQNFSVPANRSVLDDDRLIYTAVKGGVIWPVAFDENGIDVSTPAAWRKSPYMYAWSAPTAATFKGKTYLFYWRLKDDSLHYSVYDGTWSTEKETNWFIRSAHPSAVNYGGKLYVFFHDFTRRNLIYIFSEDGTNWDMNSHVNDPATQNEMTSADDPVPVVYNGLLYVFFQRVGYNYNPDYLWYTTFDGKIWTSPVQVTTDGQPVELHHPPTAAAMNGKLHVIYHGADHFEYSSIFDGLKWKGRYKIPNTQNFGDGTATVNNGRLVLYYNGPGDSLARLVSSDGIGWVSKMHVDNINLRYSPAVLP